MHRTFIYFFLLNLFYLLYYLLYFFLLPLFIVLYSFITLFFCHSSFYSPLEIFIFILSCTYVFSFSIFFSSFLILVSLSFRSSDFVSFFNFNSTFFCFSLRLIFSLYSHFLLLFFFFYIVFLSYFIFLFYFACALFSTFLIIIIHNVSKNLLQLSLYTTL